MDKILTGPWTKHHMSNENFIAVESGDGSVFVAKDLYFGADDTILGKVAFQSGGKGYPSIANTNDFENVFALVLSAPAMRAAILSAIADSTEFADGVMISIEARNALLASLAAFAGAK